MSTAQRSRETLRCTYCDDKFERGWSPDYCSEVCRHRDVGADHLRNIEHDHRWCHGCFRRVKSVEKARPQDPEFVIGYQYLTPHAEHGIKEVGGIDDGDRDRTLFPAESYTQTGTICECGTTDHRDDYLRRESVASVSAAAKRLIRAFVDMREEGQHDKAIDARELAATLRESATERGEWDWKLAVGRALT